MVKDPPPSSDPKHICPGCSICIGIVNTPYPNSDFQPFPTKTFAFNHLSEPLCLHDLSAVINFRFPKQSPELSVTIQTFKLYPFPKAIFLVSINMCQT